MPEPRDRAELREAIALRLRSAVDDLTAASYQAADDVLDVLDQAGTLCPHETLITMCDAGGAVLGTGTSDVIARAFQAMAAASPYARKEPPRD